MPAGYQNNRTWRYSLIRTTTDRTGRRTNNLSGPRSRRLVGANGALEGGIGPMRGYKKLRDVFLPALTTINNNDFWVVTLRVGAEETKRGYIYRTSGLAGVKGIYFGHWNGTSFVTHRLVSPLSTWSGNMSVTVRGRWCYIAVRGRDPIGFYFSDQSTIRLYGNSAEMGSPTDPSDSAVTVIGRLGPGPNPTMLAPDSTLHPVDASGSPDGLLSNSGGDYDGLNVGIVHILPLDTAIAGVTNQDDREAVPPQSYGYAFRLRDRVNGRYTQLSNLSTTKDTDFPVDADGVPVDGYFLYELIVDSTAYDAVQIYRTVGDLTESETSGIQANLFLDAEVTIDDYDIADAGDVKSGFSKVFVWSQSNRISILYKEQYANKTIFDERLPSGGTILHYNGQLFFADIATTEDSNQVGQVRYSSVIEQSPELFPPLNRYVPDDAQDDWIALQKFGSNAIAFSKTRGYLARMESGYLRTEELHEGFGLGSRRGLAIMGQMVYYANEKGLMAVMGDGRLDRVPVLNSLFVDQWQGDVSDVVMVFDSKDNTITGLKTSTQNGFILWLNTSTLTEFEDVPFVGADSGLVPGQTDSVKRAQWVTSNGGVYVYDGDKENTSLTVFGQGGVFDVSLTWGAGFISFVLTGEYDQRLVGQKVYIVDTNDSDDASNNHAGHSFTISTVTYDAGAGTTTIVCGQTVGGHAVTTASKNALTAYLSGGGGPFSVTVSVAPIYFRWEGWALFGEEVPDVDLFRVRRPEIMRPYFVGVSPASLDTSLVRCMIYEANDDTPLIRSFAKDTSGQVVPMIVDDEPQRAALVEAEGTMLFPSVEIVSAGLDYLMLGVVCEGTLLGTDHRGSFRS